MFVFVFAANRAKLNYELKNVFLTSPETLGADAPFLPSSCRNDVSSGIWQRISRLLL